MATAASESEETWLYGDKDNTVEAEARDGRLLSADAPPFEPSNASMATPNASQDDSQTKMDESHGATTDDTPLDDEDDSDSDDDKVQVTIGEVKPKTAVDGMQKFQQSSYIKPSQAVKAAQSKGVDVDTPGSINGVPVVEYEIESSVDHPWRQPGADITDYFNYGFTEDTWRQYCDKQKRMRVFNMSGQAVYPQYSSKNMEPTKTQTPGGSIVIDPKGGFRGPKDMSSKALGPRKMSGTIDVIGGATSRRADSSSDVDIPAVLSGSMDSVANSSGVQNFPVIQPTNMAALPPGAVPVAVVTPGIPPQMLQGAPPGFQPPFMGQAPVDNFQYANNQQSNMAAQPGYSNSNYSAAGAGSMRSNYPPAPKPRANWDKEGARISTGGYNRDRERERDRGGRGGGSSYKRGGTPDSLDSDFSDDDNRRGRSSRRGPSGRDRSSNERSRDSRR